jgi:hypothetical protein
MKIYNHLQVPCSEAYFFLESSRKATTIIQSYSKGSVSRKGAGRGKAELGDHIAKERHQSARGAVSVRRLARHPEKQVVGEEGNHG